MYIFLELNTFPLSTANPCPEAALAIWAIQYRGCKSRGVNDRGSVSAGDGQQRPKTMLNGSWPEASKTWQRLWICVWISQLVHQCYNTQVQVLPFLNRLNRISEKLLKRC